LSQAPQNKGKFGQFIFERNWNFCQKFEASLSFGDFLSKKEK
jgi:hypothetical protein